jgi:pyruvate formate lyase activating enzyme
MTKGMVFNIQKFSTGDGPGIRSTVFLKGCNLHCLWCHNPESVDSDPEIQFFANKCIGCGKCIDVCPVHAQRCGANQRVFSRELCQKCGKCVDACSTGALALSGRIMSVDEIIGEVEKDRPFYITSKGGVTFSGGEPLLQKDFLKALLMESKRCGLHTAVDTAGNIPWETYEEVIPYVDLLLFDLKVFTAERHRQYTNTSNHRILANLKRIPLAKVETWIRVPVIPGVNDNITEMEQIATFVQALHGVQLVELLPFNPLGVGKYKSLGKNYKFEGCSPPANELMETLAASFDQKKLGVKWQ